ncbi:hypothetical protein U1Q18_040275 [Sarracenia purpurea var. burkii]
MAAHCRGRGRPPKRPANNHNNLQSLAVVLSEPMIRKLRTRTVTTFRKEIVILDFSTLSDVSKITQELDGEIRSGEKFPDWNMKKKRSKLKQERELNPNPPPWMWELEIPEPIPPDVFTLGFDQSLLDNFFADFPNFDD